MCYVISEEYSRRYAYFFFFQAEDGIRDYKVTGVQTCALPICSSNSSVNLNENAVAMVASFSCFTSGVPQGVISLPATSGHGPRVRGGETPPIDRKSVV